MKVCLLFLREGVKGEKPILPSQSSREAGGPGAQHTRGLVGQSEFTPEVPEERKICFVRAEAQPVSHGTGLNPCCGAPIKQLHSTLAFKCRLNFTALLFAAAPFYAGSLVL
ncbi:hypothetical protein NDU88_006362 [Pleurodeles waltl]|uniref:Uncharacterized protein n=1 Tax=Pleurodeles waltl TaxID=8319 RepID=A0AAV7QHE2_PLEWA|nr:hypothetical protein NDU88_006362 [Pleurodeles waltl]